MLFVVLGVKFLFPETVVITEQNTLSKHQSFNKIRSRILTRDFEFPYTEFSDFCPSWFLAKQWKCILSLLSSVHTLRRWNLKRSFMFLFLHLGVPLTNPSQHRSFSKTLLKPDEFENAAFRLSDDGKRFETALLKNNNVTIITWPPCPSFHKSKMAADRCL